MKYIEVNLTKCTLFLTESEMRKLLYMDMDLYKAALKRGKAFKRTEQRQAREAKKRVDQV